MTQNNWDPNTFVPAGGNIARFNRVESGGDGAYSVSMDGVSVANYGLEFEHGSAQQVFFTASASESYSFGFMTLRSGSSVTIGGGNTWTVDSSLPALNDRTGLTVNAGNQLSIATGASFSNTGANTTLSGTFTNSGTATLGATNASGTFNSSGSTTFSSLTLSGSSTVSGGTFGRSTPGSGAPTLTFSGTGGSLSATAGTINLGSIGVASGGNGDVSLTGVAGANFNVNGNVNLGTGGTWTQSNGSADIVGSLTATTTSVSGGGLVVDSMASNLIQTGGVVTLQTGSLTGNAAVSGGGVLTVSGSVSGDLTVSGTGSSANIANGIGGNASVATGGDLKAASVSGTLTVTGGTADVSTVGFAGANHVLSGGTLNAQTITGNVTQSGGTISPGNSPGTTSIAGDVTLSGGTFALDLKLGPHVSTPGTGWDFIDIDGTFSGSGSGTYTLQVFSLDANDANGAFAGWNPNFKWEWTFLTADGGIIGFDENTGKLGDLQFVLDTFQFDSVNTTIPGDWYVRQDGNSLVLGYNGDAAAVPEPSSFAVLGILGAAGFGVRRWRRRKGQAAEGEVSAEVAQAE